MNMIKLYGKPIRVNKASSDRKNTDVGANLFIGNLDEEVDEKLLHDTFSAFGVILSNPKIMRDAETGNSKGFGFISYDSFEASDAAIEAMNGQYLCNKAITVSYAFKKDTKGERHGSSAGNAHRSSSSGESEVLLKSLLLSMHWKQDNVRVPPIFDLPASVFSMRAPRHLVCLIATCCRLPCEGPCWDCLG